MSTKIVRRVTGPVNSALGFVENAGSTTLKTGEGVWRSIGNGSRNIVRSLGTRSNNAIRRLVTGKGGRRNATRKNRKNRNATRKNRKDRKDRKDRK